MLDHRDAADAAGIEKLSDVSHRRVGFDAHHFPRHHIRGGQHGSLLSVAHSLLRAGTLTSSSLSKHLSTGSPPHAERVHCRPAPSLPSRGRACACIKRVVLQGRPKSRDETPKRAVTPQDKRNVTIHILAHYINNENRFLLQWL